MKDVRLVVAPLDLCFENIKIREDLLKKEFTSLSEFEEDPVGEWLKLAKSRGEASESDQILLTLMVELHKKVDQLTSLVKGEEKQLLDLENDGEISHIGFEHIKLASGKFQQDENYYMRIAMPVFPKREIALFAKAISDKVALIVQLHDKDQRDWNAYMASRERVMIRELKANNDT